MTQDLLAHMFGVVESILQSFGLHYETPAQKVQHQSSTQLQVRLFAFLLGRFSSADPD